MMQYTSCVIIVVRHGVLGEAAQGQQIFWLVSISYFPSCGSCISLNITNYSILHHKYYIGIKRFRFLARSYVNVILIVIDSEVLHS